MPQVANHRRGNPLWFAGVCDEVYVKIALWDEAYWIGGEVHSTRQFLEKTGEVVDKPTKMAHEIPFRETELDHLIRITEELRPGSPLIEELKEIKRIWKYGKPVMGYRFAKSYWSRVNLPPGIHRVITVAFYPEHVKDIRNMLREAKTGQKAEVAVQAKKEQGKDLFEE